MMSDISVSYTHLDVYKRQAQKVVIMYTPAVTACVHLSSVSFATLVLNKIATGCGNLG